MYQLAPKWDLLIWDVKRTFQVMPKKDGPIWDVTKTYHLDLGFMKVKSPLAWTSYFHINRLLFTNRILYQVRPYITDALTLSGWFFSIWKPPETYTRRWSTYILFHSNVKHSSQNTVNRPTMQHDVATCTWMRRTYLWHPCDVSLVGR